MEYGHCARRKKSRAERRADAAELDAYLERYARAELSYPADDEDEPELDDEISLTHPQWIVRRAWQRDKAHGLLPHGGALLDLPMDWYRDLDVCHERYGVIFERLLREREESQGRQREDSGSAATSEDYENMFSQWTDAPRRGFQDLMDG